MQTQTEHPAKRTRAQVLRDSVEIRLAVDEAGPLIAELLKANGIVLGHADWSKVFPNWLIATVDDQVVGCVQVLVAKPAGWLEFLYVDPKVSFKIRAIAIRKLLIQGATTLRAYGAQYVGGVTDVKNRRFRNVLENVGFAAVGECTLMCKRIA